MKRTLIGVWPGLSPATYLRPPVRRRLPFPLDRSSCRLYGLGRQAIRHGLQALGLRAGDEVLAPAYHHGSEIEALRRSQIGCRFYDAGPGLEPDEDELQSLLGERVRALYIIHHLGFGHDAVRWRRWCDRRDLLLLEDATMAWLAVRGGRPVGSMGDAGFFSPWKTFGLPDLGALVCAEPPPPVGLRRRGPSALAHDHLPWFAQRVPRLAERLWERAREHGFDVEEEFGPLDPDPRPSASSLFLLRRLVRTDAAAARRANHRRLLEALADRVPFPFDRPDDGSCPLMVPVWTDDKASLLAHLCRHGVDAADLWSVPHPELPVERFPEARRWRASHVALPVHQGLRERDLSRIVLAVRGAPARSSRPPARAAARSFGGSSPVRRVRHDRGGRPSSSA